MLRPGTFALTLLLAMLTGIGPLSVDMYLASLPDIGRLLGAPPAQVQLTISVYLVGFAIGQVFYGPLSDRHGRRPVLLAALGIYLLATLACALAPSIEMLIAARFVQAVGGSGAIVLARAVVRDIYDGARVGRELSRMAAIMALAPLVAPLIGGVLQTVFGWRSNFVALFCFGAAGAGRWSGCCCRRRCASARRSRCRSCSIAAVLSPLPRRPQLRHPSRHRRPAAWPGCSPGSPPPPSCCRTSTAFRRWRSAWPSRSARRAICSAPRSRRAS